MTKEMEEESVQSTMDSSITSTMIRDYNEELRFKCRRCQVMVVPAEGRVCSCLQFWHYIFCCFCIKKNLCHSKEANEKLGDVVLLCPRCHVTNTRNHRHSLNSRIQGIHVQIKRRNKLLLNFFFNSDNTEVLSLSKKLKRCLHHHIN